MKSIFNVEELRTHKRNLQALVLPTNSSSLNKTLKFCLQHTSDLIDIEDHIDDLDNGEEEE